MNRELLAELLVQLGIRHSTYDLDWRGTQGEVYALMHGEAGWHVFYAERGVRRSERIFATESEACQDLLTRIRRDPSTRSQL